MAHDVFISYAAQDEHTADAVCATLEAQRIRCWIAPRDVMPGVSYAEALIDAISESRLMVLVFSSHSNSSPQVMREVERAASKGIAILPFRIEDVAPSKFMEFFLSTPHWLDALTPPLEKHLGHLAETVKLLLSRIGKPEQVAGEVEAAGSAGTVEITVAKGLSKPTPLRKACEAAKRWGSRRVVRLGAVFAAVVGAVVVAIFVLIGLLSGGGDGGGGRSVPMFRGNPARTGVNPGPGVERSPKVLWRFETGSRSISSPEVAGGVIYIGSNDSYVYALDAVTGEQRWRFQTGHWVSSPTVVEGVVYVGSGDSYVYALDAVTGAQRWRFQTGAGVESHPAVVEGVVYIGSNDSYLYALDGATGEQHWRFQTGDEVTSSPAVLGGVVYIGSGDSYVYALEAATGAQRWRFQTGDEVASSPAVVEGVVSIGSRDNYVYALDAATGAQRWRFQTGGWVPSTQSPPAVVEGVVYVGSHDNYVYALDAATGKERWRFQTDGEVFSSPAVVDGVVYIASDDGYVYALEAATGEER